MTKSVIDAEAGHIYTIPLFLSDVPRLTRIKDGDLAGIGKKFAFMRAVAVLRPGELLIEVFRKVGTADSTPAEAVASGRLFRPIVTTALAIQKRRWRFVGSTPGYDREKDSQFSLVELVLSPSDEPVLWRGGKKAAIDTEQAKAYEPWTIWGPNQVESRISSYLAET